MAEEGPGWGQLLGEAPVAALRWRAAPETWSALEYACHSRGVLEVFAARVERMLVEDDPDLVVWDDEAAVLDEAYNEQDPVVMADALQVATDGYRALLGRVDRVAGASGAWARTGRREDDVFTVSSLSRYALHESMHHRFDASRSIGQAG
jgi:hypothetical protein